MLGQVAHQQGAASKDGASLGAWLGLHEQAEVTGATARW
jgi:hypothetical protein